MWPYQLLLKLLTPFIWLKIRRFHRNYPNYKLPEALGYVNGHIKVDLWIHCASVGEVLAVRPLVYAWQAAHPHKTLLITTVTPTGAEQVKQSFNHKVRHHYLPIDWQVCVRRFLSEVSCPQLVIMETELWPNLLIQAKQKGLKIYVINARLSERSFKRYRKFSRFSQALMQLPDLFCAHDAVDAERFRLLGARAVTVTGNIKFDLKVALQVLTDNWRAEIGADTFVWLGASTHTGEDEVLLDVHQQLLKLHPTALLLLVPRHPERFEQVYELARQRFSRVAKRSSVPVSQWSQYDVIIGDSMGELMHYYQACNVAFVGGSLIDRGGHNPIEPALLSKAILVGSHTFNFNEITNDLVSAQGAQRCHDQAQLLQCLDKLATNEELRDNMGRAANNFAKQNQGAVARVLEAISS